MLILCVHFLYMILPSFSTATEYLSLPGKGIWTTMYRLMIETQLNYTSHGPCMQVLNLGFHYKLQNMIPTNSGLNIFFKLKKKKFLGNKPNFPLLLKYFKHCDKKANKIPPKSTISLQIPKFSSKYLNLKEKSFPNSTLFPPC